jgi:hypothetical protein
MRGKKFTDVTNRFSGRRAGVKKTLICMGIIPMITGIDLGWDVLTRSHGGTYAIADYSPIAPTDTSDQEYPVILGSERENVDGVEFRVAHDPPRISSGCKWYGTSKLTFTSDSRCETKSRIQYVFEFTRCVTSNGPLRGVRILGTSAPRPRSGYSNKT